MISRTTPAFRRELVKLTDSERNAARRAYRQFRDDPNHNSLRFKKLSGYEDVWSVRISLDLRAVGRRTSGTIDWIWIGHHGNFDNLFG